MYKKGGFLLSQIFSYIAAIMIIIQASMLGCTQDNTLVYEKEVERIVEVPVYVTEEVPGGEENAEVWVDSFVQPKSVDGVDILWVIDTSGSMNRHDTNLLSGISAMLSALPPSGWRLAMISNDPVKASIESQFPLVPGDDILDAEAMYTSMGRGNKEAGFDAVYEYIVNNPYSLSWMRPDAALLVVFVSDEEEQSDQHFINISDFITWYNSQRGGSVFLSSVVNILPSDSVCIDPPATRDVGDRYIEATNYFHGVVVDICDEDWTPGVTDASNQVEPHTQWTLTHVPIEQTIRVFIDGQLDWNWGYDVQTNTIIFSLVPDASALVEIGYIIDREPVSDTGDTG